MTDQKDNFQIALSQEELLNIMAYMQIKQLPGFDLSWAKDLREEQATLSSEVAERALFARGFLARDKEGQVFVNPLVFAAVGACAIPDISVLLRQVGKDKQLITYNFHMSRKMSIVHFMPHPMIHQFLALDEKEKLLKALISNLSLPSSIHEIKQKPVDIPMKALVDARLAEKDEGLSGIRDHIPAALFTEKGFESFTTILADPDYYSVLILLDPRQNKSDDFSLLQGDGAVWLMDPSPNDSSQAAFVTVSPTTTKAVIDRISPYFIE